MTHNQIEYWKLQESKRSNLEREKHNRNVLSETTRSNMTREKEQERANRESARLQEMARQHNFLLTSQQQQETHRANLKAEKLNAERAQMDRRIRESSNLTARMEALTHQAQQMETVRSNQRREQLQDQSQQEVARANKSREMLQSQSNMEAERSNRQREYLMGLSHQLEVRRASEIGRHNQAVEAETRRANIAREAQTQISTGLNTLTSILNSASRVIPSTIKGGR